MNGSLFGQCFLFIHARDALMQRLKSLLEWYLGAPSADPGQGTAWNLHSRTPWPAGWPQWVVLLMAVAAVAFVVWLYIRDGRQARLGSRVALILLRLGAIAVVLYFMTETMLSVDRTGLPVVAVLLDESASMGLEDQYEEKKTQAVADDLIAESGAEEASRLNLAKALLTRDDGAMLKKLRARHKLQVYRFSDSAVPLGRGELLQDEDVDEVLQELGSLEATAEETRPGPAVRGVLDKLRGSPPSAVVVISDGIASSGEADSLSSVAEYARSLLVPIYIVGIGSEDAAHDLQLYDVLTDEIAFVDDPITFSAKLKAYGYAGQMLAIQVREKRSNEILANRRIRAPGDGVAADVEIAYTPPGEGEFDFTVEVVPQAKETNTQNNSEMRHVSVRRERIRVLYADSVPRYEFRYLKHLLERDRTIELHTLLQDADLEYSAEDETALDRFPVRREDLFGYDVVIFGDVDRSQLSSDMLEHLGEFVRETGGGLIVVAGSNYTPAAYRDSPLEVMLPIKLPDNDTLEAGWIGEPFRPELTLEGRKQSTVFRLGETERESLRIWNDLPSLHWLFAAPELKPGAMVLAEHPTQEGLDGRLPVIALQRYGAGKVLFHATDEFWRWRWRVGDVYYGRYWVQAIRYLSRSKLFGSDRTAELTTDRSIYRRGEAVQFRMRFFNEQAAPSHGESVTVVVERRDESPRRLQLSRLPQTPPIFEAQLPGLTEGAYHAWVVSPSFDEAPPAADFRIEQPFQELQQRRLNRAELLDVAKLTRGEYFSLAEAERLPERIPPGQPVTLQKQEPIALWSRWELLLLFAALLCGEWLLRKRCRLL